MCSLSVSVSAESPWVVVHPGNPAYTYAQIELVHFRDANTGWAAGEDSWSGQTLLLRTTDGGLTWQEELTNFPYERAFFINPFWGWTFRNGSHRFARTPLMEDIEFYHSMDGGLSWQLQRGKITGFVNISDWEPAQPFEFKTLTKVYFIDSQRGWLLGFTEKKAGKKDEYVAGNLFLFTSDGGKTWSGQFDIRVSGRVLHDPDFVSLGAPTDIEFVNPVEGWILASINGIYRTQDGGKTWERLETGLGDSHIMQDIDFVGSQNGWAGGDNALLFTQDGGATWTNRAPVPAWVYQWLYFAGTNRGWVKGYDSFPNKEFKDWILYTEDGGSTWQVEWQHNTRATISYLGCDIATATLWAGGSTGILLKRSVNGTTSVTPKGKLTTSWGKLKRGRP